MKTALTVAGSDSGGGAGIQADLKTFSAFGVYGTCAITAVTAQNTKKVEAIYELPADFVAKQIDAVMADINPRVWKTGMLVNKNIVQTVAERVKSYRIKSLVIDPVMVSTSGTRLLSNDAIKQLIESLIPLVLVITPNIPEAEVLTGIKINNVDDMVKAARIIFDMGAKNVVVKGGHLTKNNNAIDVFFDGKRFYRLKSLRIKTGNTHGTGCTFASAIAANLALGLPALSCVKKAKSYINNTLKNSA